MTKYFIGSNFITQPTLTRVEYNIVLYWKINTIWHINDILYSIKFTTFNLPNPPRFNANIIRDYFD
jgi:hypothetical protein